MNWLRRYWPGIWPNLVLTGSMMLGFLLTPTALTVVHPTSELAAYLVMGGCVFVVMAVAFSALVLVGRAVPPPVIWVWVILLALAAALLVVF